METKDEDYYHKLPRNELQRMCKRHGLPARKSNFVLAMSLFSFFKEKDMNITSKERASGQLQTCMPNLKSKETLNSLKEIDKDKDVHDKRNSQTCKVKETLQLEVDPSSKVGATAANVARKEIANVEAIEGFSYSTHNQRNGIQPVAPLHQGVIPCPKLTSQCSDPKAEHPISENVKNSDQHIHDPGRKGCLPCVNCKNKTSTAPVESGLVSSSETSMEPRPSSFQFFVRSEEGINLYVDLSSGPSDWIKVLKDEVCIYQKAHHNKSRVLHEELRSLGESSECIKTSLIGFLETGFQNKGDERKNDSEYHKSSSSSYEREICNSGSSHQAVANNILESLTPISSNFQGEARKISQEDGCVASSVCKLDSGLQSQKSSINTGSPKQSKTPLQFLDVLPIQCTQNMDVSLKSDEANCRDSLECPASKSASVCAFVNGVNDEKSLALSSINVEDSSLIGFVHHDVHNATSQEPEGSCRMEMQFSGANDHHRENNDMSIISHQLVCPLRVDLPIEEAQSEGDRLPSHQLHHETSDKYDNLVTGELARASPGEEGRSRAAVVEECSEYSELDDSSDATNKRPHSSENSEVQKKRQQDRAENESSGHSKSTEKNSRSRKRQSGASLPRRSKRLVSK